jgi:murein DD-endopeptidase MepM/ murein hydrolase activator NlpD
MQINNLMIAMRYLFKQWFHKRNIIIVSEHKVNHIPVSGGLQFCALILVASGICWASYSTGSFMAARSALKEQTQALRSVASARVESNFVPLLHASPAISEAVLETADTDDSVASLGDPMVTPSALEHNKLSARVIFLENKVSELQATNEAIIQRVRDKTSGRIDDLESIIKQTGLDPDSMKKEAGNLKKSKPRPITNAKSEGGPYIPSEMIHLPSSADEMFANLDELELLNQIVSTLPLTQPVANAEEQSGFGHRIDPFTGHLAFHSGLDLAGPVNNKIHSAADGTVAFAGRNNAYGNMVDIDHGFGIVTRYGHMSEILVKEGQKLRKGQLVGIQGSTGRSTGPHLHYEVRYHDRPMNPKKFLAAGHYVSSKE